MTGSRAAWVGFITYLVLSLTVGEMWPLSRFTMYARQEAQGAMPISIVDGEIVPVERLESFHGCDPAALRIPSNIPSRMGWRQDEIQRWVAGHSSDTAGPVTVSFGWATVEVPAGGPVLVPHSQAICTATARWRP